MVLSYSEDGINIKVNIDNSCNLTTLMAYFVEFTRMIGYQEGSWEKIIDFLSKEEFDLYEWSSTVISEQET